MGKDCTFGQYGLICFGSRFEEGSQAMQSAESCIADVYIVVEKGYKQSSKQRNQLLMTV